MESLDFEATELPFWRKKWCPLWSGSPAGIPTSQLLGELRCWYDKKDAAATWSVTELDRQTVMLEFLDGDGKTEWNMLVKDGGCSNKELLELNSGSFSDQDMAVSLGMAHALDYILGQHKQELCCRSLPLNLDDVLEVHSRVMGSAEGERKEVCQESRDLLDAHIGFVNSRADEIKAYPKLSEQAPAMLKLAATSLLWFHVRRPFADGNARVAELFVSNLLADLVPPGLHLRVALVDALRRGKMGGLKNSGGGGGGGGDIKKITEQQQAALFCLIQTPPPPPSGVEDVAALVVEAVWGLWDFTASKYTTSNGQD